MKAEALTIPMNPSTGTTMMRARDGKAAGIIIAAIAGGYLLVRGAKWAKPRVERWWNETAQPKLVVTKEKLAAKFKKAADSRQEETTSGSPEAEEIEDKGEKDAGEKV